MRLQPGFFDLSNRLELLSEQGDPLEKLNDAIDWTIFNRLLEKAFRKTRKSAAGRKPFSRILMFKVLVLQSLYNLSDAQTEYQIKDRLSFMRFLGLSLESRVPDEKTIWAFRECLIEARVFQKLFERFDRYLNTQGYHAEKGTIIDASVMPARIQRNRDDEKALLKAGAIPTDWVKNPNKLRQKDCDARWGKKDKRSQYGYKNHVVVDVKHKLIRHGETTHAAMADVSLLMPLSRHIDNQDDHLY